jgi:hypothetical protein
MDMEILIPLSLLALILLALIRALLPTPQPPRVIYIQTLPEPEHSASNGCLGGIVLILLVGLLLLSLVAV